MSVRRTARPHPQDAAHDPTAPGNIASALWRRSVQLGAAVSRSTRLLRTAIEAPLQPGRKRARAEATRERTLPPLAPSRPSDDPYGHPSPEALPVPLTAPAVALEEPPDEVDGAGVTTRSDDAVPGANGSHPHSEAELLDAVPAFDEGERTSEVWTTTEASTATDSWPGNGFGEADGLWSAEPAAAPLEEDQSAVTALAAENHAAVAADWSEDDAAAIGAAFLDGTQPTTRDVTSDVVLPDSAMEAADPILALEEPDTADIEAEATAVAEIDDFEEPGLAPEVIPSQTGPETAVGGFEEAVPAVEAEQTAAVPWYRNPLVTSSIIYLQLITVAELLVLADPPSGLFAHLGVFTLLLAHIGRTEDVKTTRVLIALTVAPITRLLSMVMPIGEVPVVWRYAMVAVPVFVSAALAIRLGSFRLKDVGMTWGRPIVQLSFLLIGIPLGIAEYFILQPAPVVAELNAANVALAAVILLLFTGFIEELLFRGMLQRAMIPVLGARWGIIYGAVAFAVLHVGYGSELDLLFVFGVGLLFGVIAYRTGSIFGVSLAHGVTNLILLVLAPFIAGHDPSGAIASAGYEATYAAPVVRTLDIGIPHVVSTSGLQLPSSLG